MIHIIRRCMSGAVRKYLRSLMQVTLTLQYKIRVPWSAVAQVVNMRIEAGTNLHIGDIESSTRINDQDPEHSRQKKSHKQDTIGV